MIGWSQDHFRKKMVQVQEIYLLKVPIVLILMIKVVNLKHLLPVYASIKNTYQPLLLQIRYATASARSDGLLLLCGGRDANSVSTATWLLET
ncbi:uncharacterized protein LOC141697422 isoform X2 [Apium graveolens]|uniref:uncharacterized protein LOC141697422 isoform X2 n=1 Tax=Apium graveolens TaxID=4045 RepID=UPI003D7A5021